MGRWRSNVTSRPGPESRAGPQRAAPPAGCTPTLNGCSTRCSAESGSAVVRPIFSACPDQVDLAIVDDDGTISDVLAARFSALGRTVRTFDDGNRALAELRGPRPKLVARLVLLDYDLPGADGLSVLRQLRDSGVLATTRVIMLTASSAPETVARVINAGVHGYVVKPFHWRELLSAAEACLAGTPPLFLIGPRRPPG
jgi:CheY-like chemotaxis protein